MPGRGSDGSTVGNGGSVGNGRDGSGTGFVCVWRLGTTGLGSNGPGPFVCPPDAGGGPAGAPGADGGGVAPGEGVSGGPSGAVAASSNCSICCSSPRSRAA